MNSIKNFTHFQPIPLALLVAVAATSGNAFAQSESSARALEEVVVTAQKREQSFQDLAISASVVTPQELAQKGITQVQDAIRSVPGVKVQNIAGTGSGRVFIRGIGTTSGDEFDSVIANGVSLNLDGVESNNASNLLGTMFDVERVEVLKGPQGTLYGSSALGGAVNVITAAPKHEFEGSVRAQFGDYDQQVYQGMINIPLGDQFAIRATATSDERDGYIDAPSGVDDWSSLLGYLGFPDFLHQDFINLGSAMFGLDPNAKFGNYGAVDSEGYRIKGLWEPNDNMSILVTYDYQENSGTSPVWMNPEDVQNGDLVCCNVDLTNGPPLPVIVPRFYERSYYYRENETLSAEIKYSFEDFADLTFTASTNEITDKGQELTSAMLRTNKSSVQTQDTYELRLTSPASSEIAWVAGAYLAKSDREYALNPITFEPSSTSGSYNFTRFGKPFDNSNIYGQVTYPLSDAFRVTVGGRYSKTEDSLDYALYTTANPCDGGVPICPAYDEVADLQTFSEKGDPITDFTWKLGFEYDLDANRLLYGHVATGYKAGGLQPPNTTLDFPVAEPIALDNYKPEESISYEVGSKNWLMDNTLQLNASLFYTVWDQMQLNTLVCSTANCNLFGGDSTYVAFYNADKSEMYGAEFDVIWLPIDNGRVTASLSLMHGEYGATDYPWQAPGFSGVVNLEGNEMANTPEYAGRVGYTHTFELFGNPLSVTIEEEFSSQYETTHEFFFAGHTQSAYNKTNLSVSYEMENLMLNAFLRNLENETVITSVFPFGVQGGEPRLWGGSISYRF